VRHLRGYFEIIILFLPCTSQRSRNLGAVDERVNSAKSQQKTPTTNTNHNPTPANNTPPAPTPHTGRWSSLIRRITAILRARPGSRATVLDLDVRHNLRHSSLKNPHMKLRSVADEETAAPRLFAAQHP